MNEQAAENIEPTRKCDNPFSKIDWKALVNRVRTILLQPKTCWAELKSQQMPLNDIYREAVLLALIPTLSQFIRRVIIGEPSYIGLHKFRWGFFAGLGRGILEFAVLLAGLYIMAAILEKLAPKFGGALDRVTATKTALYTAVPSLVGGLFALIPGLGVVGVLFGFYSLYLLWQAIPVMSGVAVEKRGGYFGQTLGFMFLAGLVMGLIMMLIAPSPLPPEVENLQRELERGTKMLEKMMPVQPSR